MALPTMIRYSAFAGADITPVITAGTEVFTLGNAQTITISTHRETFPVRSLGTILPHGWVRSSRTIAGSIVFTLFDRDALYEWAVAQNGMGNQSTSDDSGIHEDILSGYPILLDQMPPFDVHISLANERGAVSYTAVVGLRLLNTGITYSIEDLITENVVQYVADGYYPLRPLREQDPPVPLGPVDEFGRLSPSGFAPFKFTDLMKDDNIRWLIDQANPFR